MKQPSYDPVWQTSTAPVPAAVAQAPSPVPVASCRLRRGGAGRRPRPLRVGDALAALSHLQRPLALLAADVDADLRDLCLRRPGVVVARRRRLRRRRPPTGPARRPRRADGVKCAVHGRRLGRLAVRRPRLAGSRDRRRLERGQRGSARSAPEARPGRGRTHDRDRRSERHRSRRARIVGARPARDVAARPALRRARRSLRRRLCRRLLDAGAGREAWPLPPHRRAPKRPGRCAAPFFLAALAVLSSWSIGASSSPSARSWPPISSTRAT